MEYKWLNKKENSKLILFFNGWGMDEGIVEHLEFSDFDVLMFYDYNNLSTNFDFKELNKYCSKYLVAWSMGVMTATLFSLEYKSATAINGTLKPIDNHFGIPERIYDLTAKNFSPKGKDIFIKNMFDNIPAKFNIKRSFESQKSELKALKNYKADLNFLYDKIFISDNDNIIPTKNQKAYWGIEPNIKGGHAPFFLFKGWEDFV
ncbi:DUF452 family protein [bacterium]|nr:DUF452 family protein [bacterium]